ncbi:MAG: ATP-grasp domain-containing protein [Phycisphaerae bacterium]|nr:ATP-grasp domain-containing protein [Phycisphaerae bacterium]
MRVGLVYDLRTDYLAEGYSEDDVAEFDSEETIAALEGTMRTLGHAPERIGNVWALCRRLAAGERWDLVFNIAEGLSGRCRESQVPAILEAYGIPYTFSDAFVCALTLDKAFAKRIIRDSGLATPAFAVIERPADVTKVGLRYPLFAKPLAEGTGKGVDAASRINSPAELAQVCEGLLARFEQPVLVEEFLPGREFTAAILGNGAQAYVLGVMEIVVIDDPHTIYSYTAKEECEHLCRYLPFRDGALYAQIESLALGAYHALQCRDTARVDIRCDGEGAPHFIEINPLPGIHPTHSDLPMIATQEGMSYSELIRTILGCACERTYKKDSTAKMAMPRGVPRALPLEEVET